MSSETEVCMLDAGIKDLSELNFSLGVTNLNLHCNIIDSMNWLSRLTTLKHLDLSSNRIGQIRGLSSCHLLQTLNLSCNLIEKVEGIHDLKILRKMVLSYNQITDLSGLKGFNLETHQLKHVELHGNKISSLKHITGCLLNSNCISQLCFAKGSDGNPVCDNSIYISSIFSQLPWLESLDGKDKNGRIVKKLPTDDMPGLDDYLAFMNFTEEEVNCAVESFTDFSTPKIDTICQKVMKNGQTVHVSTNQQMPHGESQSVNISNENESSKDSELLEDKLTYIVNLCANKLVGEMKLRGANKSLTESSIESTTEDSEPQIVEIKKEISQKENKDSRTNLGMRKVQITKKGKRNCHKEEVGKTVVTKLVLDRQVQGSSDDEKTLGLLNEINCERERRYKAEQSSRKLLEDIRLMEERLNEAKKIYEAAICSTTKLNRELCTEKQEHAKSKTLCTNLKSENEMIKTELQEIKNFIQIKEKTSKSFEETIRSLKKQEARNELVYKKHLNKFLLEKDKQIQDHGMMEAAFKKQKDQIMQLQELLVSREQEHKISQSNKVLIGSEEFREMIKKELTMCEARYSEINETSIKQIKEKEWEYETLEDEFRMALQIEAKRYKELYSLQETTVEELHLLKTEFESLSLKEAKSKNILSEFTALVKEQKARIYEINKCKCDMQGQYKERICQMEAELSTLRKNNSKVDNLQQDKERMTAHICAQESVIQGLRSERKLWGQELAEQGASLSQERGRLDARLEAQQKEIIFLQKQLDESHDSLRIKSKLVEDQTDSIKSLKEEIIKISTEKEKMINNTEKEIDGLKNEIDNVKEHNNELLDSVNHLTTRKEELKSRLIFVEESLEKSKCEENLLKTKWDERNKLINQFEEKVIKMKNNFDEKENKLINEKNMEIDRANDAEDKVKEYENKYKIELAAMKHDFNLETRKIIVQKESEIQKAKEHVMRVEEEMRIVLSETNSQKKNLERRLTSLSKAFSELQQDLS